MQSHCTQWLRIYLLCLVVFSYDSCLGKNVKDGEDSKLSLFAPNSRRLKELSHDVLICPVTDDDDDVGLSENYDGSSHKLAAFSYGSVGKELVETLRDKTIYYYESVVEYLIMYKCNQEEESQRCVPESSPEAAKDWKGDCIVASDVTCPTSTCERTSNCYWKPAINGEMREKRFRDTEYKVAEDQLFDWKSRDSYVGGILFFAIPGIAAGLIFLLLWVVYFLGRLCCCCLWNSCEQCNYCSPVPRKEGYNICWEIRFPASLYLMCLVGIVFSGTLAFIGNEDISDACTNTFEYGDALIQDSQSFLSRAKTPLVNIDDIAQDAANDAQQLFLGTDYIQTGANEISLSFKNYGIAHREGIDLSDSRTEYNLVVTSFQDKIDPIVEDINSMLQTLEYDLYSNVDNIQIALSSAIEQIDTFVNYTKDWRNKIDDVQEFESEQRRLRQGFVLSLFIISLIFVFLGFLSILFSKNSTDSWILYLLNIAWTLCALLGTFAFLIASVALALSVFWYDACQMNDIITDDFEPIIGESAAAGANACFDGTNLAVAYNVTDQLDFQAKLDEGLAVLESVNITAEFDKVTRPLADLQDLVYTITIDALKKLNEATTSNNAYCPFNESYSKENIFEPWTANENNGKTAWALNSTGQAGEYGRLGNETNVEYFNRLYSVAGKCMGSDCCLIGQDCNIAISGWCNHGKDCTYICTDLGDGIISGYETYLFADNIENKMTADLGVVCPSGYDCPSPNYVALGHSSTMLELIKAYEGNVTGLADDLIDLTSTKVGEAMTEIEDFLCNMDVSFVGNRYTQVRDEFCETMFGGFTQISGALWVVALLLEVAAILASVLSVRLRGVSEDEASDYYGGVKSLRRVDLYG